jgi:HAD superfamily hydrolase (TIGR01509 family)
MIQSVQAIIFDLDGTLVDSHGHWCAAEARLYNLLGGVYDTAFAQLYQGKTARDVGKAIHTQLKPAHLSAEACGEILRCEVVEAPLVEIAVMPHADEVLARAQCAFLLAIASGSPRELILKILERFGWRDAFACVVSSEEVAQGKPAPDVFLEAAARLKCDPAHILVIEDSLNGVLAAKRAGMCCFAVSRIDTKGLAALADGIFPTLGDLPLAALPRQAQSEEP